MGREAARKFAREGALVVGCDVNVAAAEATAEMVRAQGGTMISPQPCALPAPCSLGSWQTKQRACRAPLGSAKVSRTFKTLRTNKGG